ncbi:MAG: ATPase, T2SS/T4P/T4SS family, partial [Actinomycetota bacterium]|nr:ATPase, T2SS/T4P/T4SS family [Actinomycetota bacterium]
TNHASTALAYLTRVRGLLLVAGPPGSGKTTAACALLSDEALATRRIVTVEDPVEHRIPRAAQQQVDTRTGATWETLVEGALLQNPDILYLGQLRNPALAETAVRLSLDRLVVASIEAPNATATLERLERLGIGRATIAEAAPLVLAVRLARQLCPQCRSIGNVTEPEIDLLSPYTHDIPFQVARPGGCPECGGAGFQGRRAVSELLQVQGDIAALIRSGESFERVRGFAWDRGDALFGRVAVEAVRAFTFSPEEIHRAILADDDVSAYEPGAPARPVHSGESAHADPSTATILVAEDDPDTRELVSHILGREGYDVVTVGNGADALYELGSRRFDLVITDLGVPMLDGLAASSLHPQAGLPLSKRTPRAEDHAFHLRMTMASA